MNNKNKAPFIKFKFDNVFLISPWLYLFEKKAGFNGAPPYYSIEILIEKTNPALISLREQLAKYEADKVIRIGYYPIIREPNFKNHDQEIEIFTNRGYRINNYAVLYLKRKSGDPELVTKDNHKFTLQTVDKSLFARGSKVNVIGSLGVNMMAGQPYLSLTGVQNVGIGFSNLIKPKENPTEFKPVYGTATDHSFSNLGTNMTPPVTPANQQEEEALNAMISDVYDDTELVPF